MADGGDVDGRSDLLYGAYLSGIALGTTSAGLHHKLCHVLGGTFNLVHADAHAVVLPHVVAFNAPALPDEMARLADALGAPGGDPAGALWDLAVASSVATQPRRPRARPPTTFPRSPSAPPPRSPTTRCRSTSTPCSACSAAFDGTARASTDRWVIRADVPGTRAERHAGLRLPALAAGAGAFEQVGRHPLGGRRLRRVASTSPPRRPPAPPRCRFVGGDEILERRRLHPRLPVAIQRADDVGELARVATAGELDRHDVRVDVHGVDLAGLEQVAGPARPPAGRRRPPRATSSARGPSRSTSG